MKRLSFRRKEKERQEKEEAAKKAKEKQIRMKIKEKEKEFRQTRAIPATPGPNTWNGSKPYSKYGSRRSRNTKNDSKLVHLITAESQLFSSENNEFQNIN